MRTSTALGLLLGTALIPAPAAAQSQGLQLTTGVDGGIDVPFDEALVPPTGLTLEAWITYDDSTIPTGLYYWPTIARMNIGNAQETWSLRVAAANNATRSLQFIVRGLNGGLNSLYYAFTPGEFAAFTHIAATYDGTVMTLYKNGVAVAARSLTGATEVQNTGGAMRIGNGDAVNAGFESWNGIIDEFRIWPMSRTAAEINATMNQELVGMPGKVVTFNLNGFAIDSSRILIGTPFGTVNWAPGQTLTVLPQLTYTVGASTTTCPRTIDSLVGSAPVLGNSAFALWATRGPRPANSPLALIAGGSVPAPPGQPPFGGVQIAFDLNSFLASTALIPASGVLGNTRFALGIPNNPAFAGAAFVFQFGYIDALCGPQGISGSDGVQITIQ